jgi:alkanesulfonate monooxygenase SsuD/methylene tetrahydromethanopterin reductase-like flavin-dependent oxidoreductase (luciferase family)
MIGSMGERILPLIARRADAWDTWFFTPEAWDPAGYEQKWKLLQEHAVAAGRDPATIVRSVSATAVKLPRTAEDSAHWVDRLTPFANLGVQRFIFDFGSVVDTEPVLRFAEEVIAPLNQGR